MNFINPFGLPIDTVMIVIVLLSGLFQQKYLATITKLNGAWKTLIVSFIFCSIYAVLFAYANAFAKDLPLKWFFSYVLATSLYELLLKKFLDKYFS